MTGGKRMVPRLQKRLLKGEVPPLAASLQLPDAGRSVVRDATAGTTRTAGTSRTAGTTRTAGSPRTAELHGGDFSNGGNFSKGGIPSAGS